LGSYIIILPLLLIPVLSRMTDLPFISYQYLYLYIHIPICIHICSFTLIPYTTRYMNSISVFSHKKLTKFSRINFWNPITLDSVIPCSVKGNKEPGLLLENQNNGASFTPHGLNFSIQIRGLWFVISPGPVKRIY
jgi:hypothetical protein